MRHTKKTVKLGRKAEHRNLLLANQICSLIEHSRIKTTLAKAKAVRPLHARRLAFAFLRQKEAVRRLFADVAPRSGTRHGGYVRIVKLGLRQSDSAPMAYVEWVDQPLTEPKIDLDEKPEKKAEKK